VYDTKQCSKNQQSKHTAIPFVTSITAVVFSVTSLIRLDAVTVVTAELIGTTRLFHLWTDQQRFDMMKAWSLGLEVSVSRRYFGTSRSRENLVRSRSRSRSRLRLKIKSLGLASVSNSNVSFISMFQTYNEQTESNLVWYTTAISQLKQVAQLSQRDGAVGWVSFGQKSQSGRLGAGDSILWTLQVYLQPLWRNWLAKLSNLVKKTQNKSYYAVQGHSRSPRLVSIESPYATSY